MIDFHVKTDPRDLLTIGEHQYNVASWINGVVTLRRVDDPAFEETVSASTMHSIWGRTDFRYVRYSEGYLPSDIPAPTVSTLNKSHRDIVTYRLAYVQGYLRLLADPNSLYRRTYVSARAAAMALQPVVDGLGTRVTSEENVIASDVEPFLKRRKGRVGKPMLVDGKPQILAKNFPSGETLLSWMWAFRDAGGDAMALRPQYGKCGYFGSHLAPEVEATVSRYLATYYLTLDRPSETQFLEKVQEHVKFLNVPRRLEGLTPFPIPGMTAIKRAIGRLSEYYIDSKRYGEDWARAAHPWVTDGYEVNVPGQRVEIDAYEVDVVSLMTMSGFWEGLTEQERKLVRKKRMWLTIAIDRATRCIVGMRLSETPTIPNAIRTIEMVESDKSHLSADAGTKSIWHQRCGIMTVAADGGYVSSEIRQAMADSRGTIEYPPAHSAYFRAVVERIFGTVASDLMRRLNGKTFSNIIQRADYDSSANASLTVDEMCWLLVTWVVDIYHNTPHESLDFLTPSQAWDRAVIKYGVHPWRDTHGRRSSFGVRVKRKLREFGFEVLGNQYQDDILRDYYFGARKGEDREYEICIDQSNLGAVSVIIDEIAYAIPCADDRMEGVGVADWIETTQQLRMDNRMSTEMSREIAHDARRRIEQKNDEAGIRRGIAEQVYSEIDIDTAEKENFSNFRYVDDPASEASDVLGVTIGSLDIGATVAPPSDADHITFTEQPTEVDGSHRSVDPPPDEDDAWPMED